MYNTNESRSVGWVIASLIARRLENQGIQEKLENVGSVIRKKKQCFPE